MSENPVKKLNDLYLRFSAGEFDRREFMTRASGLGLSAAALSWFFRAIPATAQEASPVATFEPFTSIDRETYKAQLAEAFPFTKDIGAEQTGGTIIYGELASSDLNTFNALLADSAPTLEFMGMINETLVGSSPIDGQYVPGVADSWDIAEDGKTYTFHLNPNAKFHDGTPLTSADVVFSFDAQSNDATASSYTTSFRNAVASYRAIDDHTVEVVAADVLAQVVFLGNAYAPIMPKHIWESVPFDQWAADPGSTGDDPTRVVGSGPLKFDSRDQGAGTTTFVANTEYWDGPPVWEKLIFSTRPDDVAAVEALRAGEIDIFDDVPQASIESLQGEPDLQIDLYDTYSFGWYGYNLDPEHTTLFQDVKVRQALLYALDRQSVVDNILLGLATVANGPQPTLSIAYAPDQVEPKYTYDPDKAASLLDEAGWVAGSDGIREKDGQKLSFKVMYGSGSASSDQIIAFFQENWKAVGVEGTPDPVDFSGVLVPAITDTRDFEVCFLGFNWDATGDQSAMYSTDGYAGGFNVMKYSNPEVDKLNAEANRELDPEKRKELLIQSASLVNADLPNVVLWYRKGRTGYNKTRIHNFAPNALAGWYWSLPFVWVSQ
jgi:peptide/nickel transport system substrate-binding protein